MSQNHIFIRESNGRGNKHKKECKYNYLLKKRCYRHEKGTFSLKAIDKQNSCHYKLKNHNVLSDTDRSLDIILLFLFQKSHVAIYVETRIISLNID